RDYVRGGQRLLGADLIFADGLGSSGAVAASLDQAREAEDQSRDAAAASGRSRQQITAAAAAGVALLIVRLLVPRPAGAAAESFDTSSVVAVDPDSVDST